jgi:ferric-dicitrate binding protein FerR (iron transport regulator)
LEEKNIRQLLEQYLLGNAAAKDITAVDNWYKSLDNEELVTLSEEETAVTRQEIWDKVQPAIRVEKKVWTLPHYLKVAAMVIIIAGAGVVFLLLKTNKDNKNNTITYTTISTGVGEKKRIVIQDGSLLTLDAETTVRIQNDFSGDRKIELVDGEVFFDVKKDEQRPFVIQSQGLTTTVLGTSFNISAYKELNNLSIGVLSGKVSVASQSAPLSILEKKQQLVYDKNNKRYKKIALDESLTAWQNGRLILNDLSFNEMAVIIRKNFGIDIATNDDAIRRTRYTTELLTSMSPVEAVQVLAAIHNLKIKGQGKNIFLSK